MLFLPPSLVPTAAHSLCTRRRLLSAIDSEEVFWLPHIHQLPPPPDLDRSIVVCLVYSKVVVYHCVVVLGLVWDRAMPYAVCPAQVLFVGLSTLVQIALFLIVRVWSSSLFATWAPFLPAVVIVFCLFVF